MQKDHTIHRKTQTENTNFIFISFKNLDSFVAEMLRIELRKSMRIFWISKIEKCTSFSRYRGCRYSLRRSLSKFTVISVHFSLYYEPLSCFLMTVQLLISPSSQNNAGHLLSMNRQLAVSICCRNGIRAPAAPREERPAPAPSSCGRLAAARADQITA